MGAKNVEEKDVRLGEEELRNISGGAIRELDNSHAVRRIVKHAGIVSEASGSPVVGATAAQPHFCIKCNKTTAHNVYSGGRMVCSVCGTTPAM